MDEVALEKIMLSHRARIRHVEVRLLFLGEVRRAKLTQHFGIQSAVVSLDASTSTDNYPLPFLTSQNLSRSTSEVLAKITRAIQQRVALRVCYQSISSERTFRKIVPFALRGTRGQMMISGRAFSRSI